MNIVKAYLKYIIKAKQRHGIHSPFVYNLQDKGLRFNVDLETKLLLKNLRNLLKKNHNTIEIKDLGAGSKKLSNIRKVKDISKTSSSGKKYGTFLYQIVHHLKAKNVLELGTSLGLGTIYLASGNKDAVINSIEGCSETLNIARENIRVSGLKNITTHNSSFTDYICEDKTRYDVVFIDGDHRGSSVLSLIKMLEKNTKNDTIFIIDDIRWSDDMYAAWQNIVNNKEYHLTIDYFRMGVFAKRKQQEKEHFILKF